MTSMLSPRTQGVSAPSSLLSLRFHNIMRLTRHIHASISAPIIVLSCLHTNINLHVSTLASCKLVIAVTAYQVKRLFIRFQRLDKNSTGCIAYVCLLPMLSDKEGEMQLSEMTPSILWYRITSHHIISHITSHMTNSAEDFASIPELVINPLSDRMIHIFGGMYVNLPQPPHHPIL